MWFRRYPTITFYGYGRLSFRRKATRAARALFPRLGLVAGCSLGGVPDESRARVACTRRRPHAPLDSNRATNYHGLALSDALRDWTARTRRAFSN